MKIESAIENSNTLTKCMDQRFMKLSRQIFLLVHFCLFSYLVNGQTLIKGQVQDSISSESLIGYSVVIRDDKGNFNSGTTGDKSGKFEILYPKLDVFTLEISHVGFVSKALELNKETVAPFYDIRLKSNAQLISELEIVSSPYHYFNLDELGEISINKDHPGMAASFDDPSRSVLRIPGVGTTNDQANTISYHGLPNEMVNWKLDGAEIINPNHLSSAGTTSNRPASNSGGVLAVPFEVLEEYKFYPSPFSKIHGNAIAGISDLIPKKHIPRRSGFAKIGLLGLEAGVSKKFTEITGIQAQYRYSFTSLLGDLGVKFDGETIRYQDLFLRLHFHDTPNKGIYFTTILGHNKNDKRVPELNQRTEAYLGNMGINYFENFSEKSKIRISAMLSGKKDEGFSSISSPTGFGNPFSSLLADKQYKISMFTEYRYSPKPGRTQILAVNATHWDYDYFYIEDENEERTNTLASSNLAFQYGSITYGLEIETKNWFVKPEFALAVTPQRNLLLEPGFVIGKNSEKFKILAGINFANQNQNAAIYSLNEEPRLSNSFNPSGGGQADLKNTRSLNTFAAITFTFNEEKQQEFTSRLFHHNIFNLAIPDEPRKYFPYTGIDYLRPDKLRNEGSARSTGIEMMYTHALSNTFHLVLNGSVFNSEHLIDKSNNTYTSAPHDFGYTSNLLATKKFWIGTGSLFISFATHFRGGAYVPNVDSEKSMISRRTVYTSNFTQLSDYFRLDTRVNYTFKKKNQIILDIQNLTNKLNDGYYSFDQNRQQVVLEKQLGLIPVISYRREF